MRSASSKSQTLALSGYAAGSLMVFLLEPVPLRRLFCGTSVAKFIDLTLDPIEMHPLPPRRPKSALDFMAHHVGTTITLRIRAD